MLIEIYDFFFVLLTQTATTPCTLWKKGTPINSAHLGSVARK